MKRKVTTANEPVEQVDPGGTRPARPAGATRAKPEEAEQKVESGDRNISSQEPPKRRH